MPYKDKQKLYEAQKRYRKRKRLETKLKDVVIDLMKPRSGKRRFATDSMAGVPARTYGLIDWTSHQLCVECQKKLGNVSDEEAVKMCHEMFENPKVKDAFATFNIAEMAKISLEYRQRKKESK